MMRSVVKPPASSRKKHAAAHTGTAQYGSNTATVAEALQLENRATASALVTQVTRQLQHLATFTGTTAASAALAVGTVSKTTDNASLPAVRGLHAAAAVPLANSTGSPYQTKGQQQQQQQQQQSVSLQAVSEYLQAEVSQLVAPMRRDHSSRDDYARHVQLLDAFLYHGNGAHGCTPSMVLAGVAEMLALFHEAYQEGQYFEPLQGTGAASGLAREPSRARAPEAGAPAAAWASISLESFLPPLVTRVGEAAGQRGGGVSLSSTAGARTAASAVLPTTATTTTTACEKGGTTTRDAGEGRGGAGQWGAAHAGKHSGADVGTAAAEGQRTFTVPDALHALLAHLGEHPLVCLTADDQRYLPEAVRALAEVLAGIVATTVDEGQPGEHGPMARADAVRSHNIRLTALTTMHALLAPLLQPRGAAGAASISLVNGRPTRSMRLTATAAVEARAGGNPLYAAAARPVARALVEAGDSTRGVGASYVFTGLLTHWRRTLEALRGGEAGEDAGEDGEGAEGQEESRHMAPPGGGDEDGEEDNSARAVPVRRRQGTQEVTVVLRIIHLLFDVLTAAGEDPMSIPVVRAQVPSLVLRTLAQSSAVACPGSPCSLNATLCVDVLWQLMEASPAATATAILYTPPTLADDPTPGLDAAAVPMADLFQALLSELNATHHQLHREMRNDLVAFLAQVLRADTVRGDAVAGAGSVGSPSLRPVMAVATVDALNATVLVLFDLLCGPECGSGGDHHRGPDGAEGDGWLALTTTLSSRMPVLTQQALQRHGATAVRHRAASSPSLRKDALQFKRLGWQCLQLFYDWQVAHLARTLFASEDSPERGAGVGEGAGGEAAAPSSATREADYSSFALVDLCRMGFVDVLLMYGDTACDCPAVVGWTREELLTLQLDAWTLLAAMVGTSGLLAEVNRAYGLDAEGGVGTTTTATPAGEDDDGVEHGPEPRTSALPVLHLSPADAQFVAADGIGIVLRYLQLPPREVALTRWAATASGTEKGRSLVAPASLPAGTHTSKATSSGGSSSSHAHSSSATTVVVSGKEELEAHKKAALVMLSALASNCISTRTPSSAPSWVVRKALLREPGLVGFLVDVLDAVRAVAGSERGVGGASHPAGAGRRFFLTESEMDVALSALNLLVGIGEAAVELGGGIREVLLPPPATGGHRGTQIYGTDDVNADGEGQGSEAADGEEQGSESDPLLFGNPRWNPTTARQEALIMTDDFIASGGVASLVAWLGSVLEPEAGTAERLGQNSALTAGRTITGVGSTPGSAAPTRAPPLMESLLVRYLPMLSSILDAVGALVVGVSCCEAEFVAAGGVYALLDVAEAMAIVSIPGNIFEPFMASRTGAAVALDATVIVRDAACSLQDARAKERAARERAASSASTTATAARSEQRMAFHTVLSTTLNTLSDLLFSNAEARAQFTLWRSRRIERVPSPSVCGGGPGMSPHTFMNAVQLMVNLWLSALPPRPSTSSDEGERPAAGLAVLHLPVRDGIGENLRREYIRHLMRAKVMESTGSGRGGGGSFGAGNSTGACAGGPLGGDGLAAACASVFTDEDLVRFAVYIVQGGSLDSSEAVADREAVVSRILQGDGGIRRETVREMQLLMRETEEAAEVRRASATKEYFHRYLGIGVRAYSCLAGLGFEAMLLPSERAETESRARGSPTTITAEGHASHGDSQAVVRAVPLSPAERAQLAAMAALPVLCADEVCLAMATVALETAVLDGEVGAQEDGQVRPPDYAQQVFLRPTTPDRRRLLGVLDEVYARGSELAQLTRLCEEVEEAQAQQLLDRFLATRLRFAMTKRPLAGERRQPPGQGGMSTGMAASLLASPQAQGSTLLLPPPQLAASLRRRLEERQQQAGERALGRTLTANLAGSATAISLIGVAEGSLAEEAGESATVERRAEQLQAAASRMGGSATLGPASTLLADAAHTLATSHPRTSEHTPTAPATAADTAADVAAPKQLSSSYGVEGRPLLSLAERREKKLAMIASSLRRLPGTAGAGGVEAYPSSSGENPLPAVLPITDGYTGARGSVEDSGAGSTRRGARTSAQQQQQPSGLDVGASTASTVVGHRSKEKQASDAFTDTYNVSLSSSNLSLVEIDLGRV